MGSTRNSAPLPEITCSSHTAAKLAELHASASLKVALILAIGIGFRLLCLALFGAAAFFLANRLARALTAVSQYCLGYNLPVPAQRIASWACALFALILVPMKGCSHWQESLYRQAIPAQLGPLAASTGRHWHDLSPPSFPLKKVKRPRLPCVHRHHGAEVIVLMEIAMQLIAPCALNKCNDQSGVRGR